MAGISLTNGDPLSYKKQIMAEAIKNDPRYARIFDFYDSKNPQSNDIVTSFKRTSNPIDSWNTLANRDKYQ